MTDTSAARRAARPTQATGRQALLVLVYLRKGEAFAVAVLPRRIHRPRVLWAG